MIRSIKNHVLRYDHMRSLFRVHKTELKSGFERLRQFTSESVDDLQRELFELGLSDYYRPLSHERDSLIYDLLFTFELTNRLSLYCSDWDKVWFSIQTELTTAWTEGTIESNPALDCTMMKLKEVFDQLRKASENVTTFIEFEKLAWTINGELVLMKPINEQ